jgi:selenocysteine lyase/cysteine desulfurase
MALTNPPVSPLRSNLTKDDDLLTELRQDLGRLFNISDWERIFFCSSATDAINRVLQGISWRHCSFSPDSHNSILRPLHNNIRTDSNGAYSLMAINHCSNVTGEIADVRNECGKSHQANSLLLLDAAQSAGCIPIDVDGWGVDILVFTGHKSLLGPTGTGGYYVRRSIDFRPSQYGGTGRDSKVIEYSDGNWEYEVGTQNMAGLSGLKAGVDYVLEHGVEIIQRQEHELTLWLINKLKSIPNVLLYTASTPKAQGPVVSFNIKGLNPSDVGYILQNSYGITVRTGLHCSPLIHKTLGTERHGTVRVSLSYFTTQQDLKTLVQAVRNISNSL